MPASVFTIYTHAYDMTGLATPLWSVLTRSTDGVALSDVSATNLWASSLSVGGGGTAIPAISSMSSKIPAWVVQPSATSFTVISWPAVKNGDIILMTPFGDAAASSLSSGIIFKLSHATINGRFEFRLSNNSTLVQNQSSKTWYFTRISPF